MPNKECKDIKNTYVCSNCMEETKADEWACDCSCIDCGTCVSCHFESDEVNNVKTDSN